MNPSLVRLRPAEWPALAEFIHRCNQRPEGGVHCLHSARGPDVATHAAELAALPPDEAAFWAIKDGETLLGVVGCEFDPTLARGWLRGPVVTEPRVLDAAVPLIGPALESALPGIRDFDAFPSADDAPLNAYYAAAGYARLQLHTILRAAIGELPAHPRQVRRATAHDVAAVLHLHRALFPLAYIGEAQLLRAVDDADHALFVATDEHDAPVGYLYVQDDAPEQEAYVDYLGVVLSHRGRGLGRALLDAAARWGAAHGRGQLALTVREDRPSALSLYRQAGFVQLSAGRHWRKTVRDAAPLPMPIGCESPPPARG